MLRFLLDKRSSLIKYKSESNKEKGNMAFIKSIFFDSPISSLLAGSLWLGRLLIAAEEGLRGIGEMERGDRLFGVDDLKQMELEKT